MTRPTNNAVKNKLLNLQSLKKYSSGEQGDSGASQAFAVRKPLNMNTYDYSVFTHYPNDDDMQSEDFLPPAVKESQIKAWESAEKISKSLIFDDSSSDEEDGAEDGQLQSKEGDVIIKTLPGYTRGELGIIQARYGEKQKLGPQMYSFSDEEEKKLLWDFRKRQQATQEKLFSQYLSLSNKRKIQIAQKKDLLYKMFGYNNNLNQEYTTNNTSYSAIDNVSNTQKAFYEDKEEIGLLIDEDRLFHQSLQETKTNLKTLQNNRLGLNKTKLMKLDLGEFDYEKFQSIVSFKLGHLYDEFFDAYDRSSMIDDEEIDEVSEELYHFTVSFLRRCIKDTDDFKETI